MVTRIAAYEILSDPEKRKIYDQYGLEFLLRGGTSPPPPSPGGAGGVPPFMRSGTFPGAGFGGGPAGAGGARTGHFSFGGVPHPFMPGNPANVWEHFLRTEGQSVGGGMGGGGMDTYDFDINFSSSPLGHGRTRAHREPPNGRSKTPETTIVEKPIGFSLEE